MPRGYLQLVEDIIDFVLSIEMVSRLRLMLYIAVIYWIGYDEMATLKKKFNVNI